jgi:putative adhesin MAA1
VISGYDSSKFIATATEVKVEEVDGKKKITISYEIHAIVNKDIKVLKTNIQVETNYNKDVINPHNLSAEECKNFLTDAIKDEKICPFYSKDKTYIEKLNNLNLSNKSFFIEGKKLNNLIYNFGNVYKKDNKYYVEAELSFAY